MIFWTLALSLISLGFFYFYSITIDDIVYVIDCGFVKVKDFNPEKGLQTLESFPVSRANAQQRKGRAGRYSVYTEINLPLHSQKHGHFFLVKKNQCYGLKFEISIYIFITCTLYMHILCECLKKEYPNIKLWKSVVSWNIHQTFQMLIYFNNWFFFITTHKTCHSTHYFLWLKKKRFKMAKYMFKGHF